MITAALGRRLSLHATVSVTCASRSRPSTEGLLDKEAAHIERPPFYAYAILVDGQVAHVSWLLPVLIVLALTLVLWRRIR